MDVRGACVSVLLRTCALSTIKRYRALNLASYVRDSRVCSARALCVLVTARAWTCRISMPT